MQWLEIENLTDRAIDLASLEISQADRTGVKRAVVRSTCVVAPRSLIVLQTDVLWTAHEFARRETCAAEVDGAGREVTGSLSSVGTR